MNKLFIISVSLFATLLVGCGGGGGGGGGGASSTSIQPPNVVTPYQFTTSVFSHPAPGDSVRNPRYMTFDGSNFYLAVGLDGAFPADGDLVIKIGMDGTQTRLTSTAYSGSPSGIAVVNQRLFVSQSNGVFSADLNLSWTNTSPGLETGSNSSCANCLALIFADQHAYATIGGNLLIFNFNLSAPQFSNIASTVSLTGISSPQGLAIAGGMLYVTDYSGNKVVTYDLNSLNRPPVASKSVGGNPYAVAVASNGDVYVSLFNTNQVARIHNGLVENNWLDHTKVCHPTGIVINETEHPPSLYVASQSGANCGDGSQNTGYVLKASIDLSP